MHTFMPEEPEVERYICQNDKTIYINMEARKGAQITKLIK